MDMALGVINGQKYRRKEQMVTKYNEISISGYVSDSLNMVLTWLRSTFHYTLWIPVNSVWCQTTPIIMFRSIDHKIEPKEAHIMSSEDTTHRNEPFMSDSVRECTQRLGDIGFECCLRGQE